MPSNTSGRVGYFGPAGTFTHQALQALRGVDQDQVPYPTVGAGLSAVRTGEIETIMVPIENSVEGGVSATLDNLALSDPPLMITGEIVQPVRFGLYGRPGAQRHPGMRILTHPHAAAQCRAWLATNYPDAEVTEGPSTAGAASEVANPNSVWDAAICAPLAGQLYGLTALATEIADNAEAVTRFVTVTRLGRPPAASGNDKTTLVLFQRDDHPGGLTEILSQFASRGVNLCRLESRPTKALLGDYCFSVDVEGHVADAQLGDALMGLHRVCRNVIFLGSYPRADGTDSHHPGSSNAAYTEAQQWLSQLRASNG